MKNALLVVLFGLSVFMLSCSGPAEQSATAEEATEEATEATEEVEVAVSSENTGEVLDHHMTAFGENDLEAVMADYTDESVVITPDTTFIGTDRIAELMTGLFEAFPTEGTSFSPDKVVVEGDMAYIIWHASTPTLEVSFATDTFIIQHGKIVRQTFAGVMSPVE